MCVIKKMYVDLLCCTERTDTHIPVHDVDTLATFTFYLITVLTSMTLQRLTLTPTTPEQPFTGVMQSHKCLHSEGLKLKLVLTRIDTQEDAPHTHST